MKKPGFRIRVDIAGSGSGSDLDDITRSGSAPDLDDIAGSGSGSDPTKRDPDPDPPKMHGSGSGSGSDLKIISKFLKFYRSNMILVQ